MDDLWQVVSVATAATKARAHERYPDLAITVNRYLIVWVGDGGRTFERWFEGVTNFLLGKPLLRYHRIEIGWPDWVYSVC